MKRSQTNAAIARCIANAAKFNVPLPRWADWNPSQFDASADGMRHQKLGWKVIDFGLGTFESCGLVVLVLTSPLVDKSGEPLKANSQVGDYEYPVTSFSRKLLFVQAGQTEPHHFHRQKARKEVTILGGAPVTFELAWADGDDKLSKRDVNVQVDGIWHKLKADGEITIQPGETITLPGELSHIIKVATGGPDTIMMETCTANNDTNDNIFPFMTPTGHPIEEDEAPRYQHLDEHK